MSRAEELRALHDVPAGQAALRTLATPLPDDVEAWLGGLALLEGLPFDLLVPDARMLPPESIRFFHLDDNWLAALRDGALSAVQSTEQDTRMLVTHREPIAERVALAASRRRSRRRSRARLAEPPPPRPWSGFLLRSAAVAGWPGMTVTGSGDAAGTEVLPLLRLERVAPTVLLAIFGGTVQRVALAEPAHGLHFGVLDAGPDGAYQVYLRGIGGAKPAGQQIEGASVDALLRPGGRAVLDVLGLHQRICDGLTAAYGGAPVPPVGAGAFGLQVVASAERQPFVATAPAPGGGRP